MSLENKVLAVGALGVVAVVAYGMLKNQGSGGLLGGLFTGSADALFGNKITSGQLGADLGAKAWAGIVPGSGDNPAYPNPDSPSGMGQTWGDYWFGSGITLDVAKTDQAFANAGLTTVQVEKLQALYGVDAYIKMQNAIFSGSLTPDQIGRLRSGGWTGSGGAYHDYTIGTAGGGSSSWDSPISSFDQATNRIIGGAR
jgi:hypothetical protein